MTIEELLATMTVDEVFDFTVTMGGRGCRLDRNRIPKDKWDSVYAEIVAMAEQLFQSARSHLPLPPIHFDFIYSSKPNALAFKAKGCYYIGVTTGLIFMFNFLFCRMLSDARLFPLIGNPKAEQDGFAPLRNYTIDAQEMCDKKIHPGLPKDSVRRSYAHHLNTMALHFVIGHELGHITRGHIDYLNAKTGSSMISECEDTNREVLDAAWNLPRDEEKVERQAIEADADKRSVLAAIAAAYATHEARLEGPLKNRLTVQNLLFDWSVAMNTFFRLFGDLRVTAANVSADYPPPPLRRFLATVLAHRAVTGLWKPPDRELDTLHALKNGAIYPETAFQCITGECSSGINDAFSAEGAAYGNKLDNYWQTTLAAKIQKHAYEFDPNEIAKPVPPTAP